MVKCQPETPTASERALHSCFSLWTPCGAWTWPWGLKDSPDACSPAQGPSHILPSSPGPTLQSGQLRPRSCITCPRFIAGWPEQGSELWPGSPQSQPPSQPPPMPMPLTDAGVSSEQGRTSGPWTARPLASLRCYSCELQTVTPEGSDFPFHCVPGQSRTGLAPALGRRYSPHLATLGDLWEWRFREPG